MQQDYPNAGHQLAERLLNWSVINLSQIISAYWPINSEIDIRPFITAICAQGQQIALPITDFDNDQITFHLWHPDLPLKLSNHHIMQPDNTCPRVDPDIILLPLLAFDTQGHRLGYGRGHYDRALQYLRSTKSLIAVGIGYDAQLVSHIPINQYDQRLDYIVTPDHIYDCSINS